MLLRSGTLSFVLVLKVVEAGRQRCRISLAVTSFFIQLLETPWMPANAQRPEIGFTPNEQFYTLELTLGYSLIQEKQPPVATKTGKQPGPTLFGPMEPFNILLLEFCFWPLFESQPLRASFSLPKTEMEKLTYDLAAAYSWKTEVLGG